MEKVKHLNPERIVWCCSDRGISQEELSKETEIALKTLQRALDGEAVLSTKQLQKIASFFGRGILFFLESAPVNESIVHTPHFRTLTNKKPTLSPKLKLLIERVERHRLVYLGLLEDANESIDNTWYPDHIDTQSQDIDIIAPKIREWLGLKNSVDFSYLRTCIEAKGIIVLLSNGYQGQWQIPKENPIRGFSLYFTSFPVIVVKKQESEGAQAFTLMHELAHLLLHKESSIDDNEDIYSYRGIEKTANQFAGKVLVPDDFLRKINLGAFPFNDITAYDNYLHKYRQEWCVSSEVILRRLLDTGHLSIDRYKQYRTWRLESTPTAIQRGGQRYRHREPLRIFGDFFVKIVIDALQTERISLSRASTYLDNLKITDLHKLEKHVRI